MTEKVRTYEELLLAARSGEGDLPVTDREVYNLISYWLTAQGQRFRIDRIQGAWMKFLAGEAQLCGRRLVPMKEHERNYFGVKVEEKYKLFSKKIKIKRLDPRAKLPTYAHGPEEDAGMDLYALEDVLLRPSEPALVSTGVSIELPPGYEAQIRSRASLAGKHGIIVPNSPGTVDPGYRGELKVLLLWLPNYFDPFTIYKVNAGDRIAQLVVAQYQPVEWEEVTELADSTRGEGGFGSKGA